MERPEIEKMASPYLYSQPKRRQSKDKNRVKEKNHNNVMVVGFFKAF
jgi:hypothetical protein